MSSSPGWTSAKDRHFILNTCSSRFEELLKDLLISTSVVHQGGIKYVWFVEHTLDSSDPSFGVTFLAAYVLLISISFHVVFNVQI